MNVQHHLMYEANAEYHGALKASIDAMGIIPEEQATHLTEPGFIFWFRHNYLEYSSAKRIHTSFFSFAEKTFTQLLPKAWLPAESADEPRRMVVCPVTLLDKDGEDVRNILQANKHFLRGILDVSHVKSIGFEAPFRPSIKPEETTFDYGGMPAL